MALLKDITTKVKSNYSLGSHTHSHIKNDLKIGNESGSSAVEGGEIVLTAPPQLSDKVNLSIDNYNNHFRIFKNGGGGHVFDLDVVGGTMTFAGNQIVRLVSSWRSGYNWYRVYSDGFIEQGGTFGANTGSWADVTFSFPKAFSNTNYNLFVQGNWSSAECSSCLVHARSASSVTVRHANNYYSTMPSYFVAYGT